MIIRSTVHTSISFSFSFFVRNFVFIFRVTGSETHLFTVFLVVANPYLSKLLQ
jgi:hypothetical protein